MTREEVIEYLKRADVTVGREIKTKTAKALEMAIKALDVKYDDMINCVKGMPPVTPQEPRWIPVSERLPEELWGVLVYCPTNDNIFCAYLEKGVWKIFSPEALEEIKEIVTAWMPLPKAYREENEDDKA